MRHQSFETWITAEEPLAPEQAEALKSHLASCEDCRKLHMGWQAAHTALRAAPEAAPTPGFSRRFQASLAERRYRQQQLQIRRIILFLVGGSLVAFVALLAYLLFVVSPAGVLVNMFRTVTQTYIWWNTLQETLFALIRSLPIYIPVALWILFTTSLSVFSLIWVVSVWRISTQGVSNK